MIHTLPDVNRPKFARHFNEARSRGLEHQLAKFRRGNDCVAADAFF